MYPTNFPSKQQITEAFNRVASQYDKVALLQQEVGSRLVERLDLLRLQPKLILDAGAGTGHCSRLLEKRYRQSTVFSIDMAQSMLVHAKKKASWRTKQRFICAQGEQLPFATRSMHAILSNLMLYWCMDAELVLLEMKRILKTDGCLFFTTFGPDTFHELRACLQDINLPGSLQPFLDMHDLGDLLLKIGFTNPVMDMEKITLTYSEFNHFLSDMVAWGEYDLFLHKAFKASKDYYITALNTAYERYRNEQNKLPVTFEIVYGHAFGAPSTVKASGMETIIPLSMLKKDISKS
jgi:malonyl-CoA O-methyltransferase